MIVVGNNGTVKRAGAREAAKLRRTVLTGEQMLRALLADSRAGVLSKEERRILLRLLQKLGKGGED